MLAQLAQVPALLPTAASSIARLPLPLCLQVAPNSSGSCTVAAAPSAFHHPPRCIVWVHPPAVPPPCTMRAGNSDCLNLPDTSQLTAQAQQLVQQAIDAVKALAQSLGITLLPTSALPPATTNPAGAAGTAANQAATTAGNAVQGATGSTGGAGGAVEGVGGAVGGVVGGATGGGTPGGNVGGTVGGAVGQATGAVGGLVG